MLPESEIIDILNRLYKSGLTTSSGGNLSVRGPEGDIWITPASIDKGNLAVSDLVNVRKDGTIIGKHKPSSELLFHRAIYNSCPGIKAILHAHPPYLVAFCITGEKITTAIQPDIYNICGEIGYVPYSCPGSEELANDVSDAFTKGFSMVMMENHGIVVGGASLTEAYTKMIMLNMAAEAIINTKYLGNLNMLSSEQIKMAGKSHLPCVDSIKRDASDVDQECCQLAVKIAKRAFTQNLLTGNLGAVSVRKDGQAVISRHFVDWDRLSCDDFMSLYKKDLAGYGSNPYDVSLFRKIFEKHPDINCIIHSYAPACFAFSLSDCLFKAETVPEGLIILKEVLNIEYDVFYSNNVLISQTISNSKPVILLKNNGIIVAGDIVEQAFDRLEVAEFTAKSILYSKRLGKVRSIGEEEVNKIRLKYSL